MHPNTAIGAAYIQRPSIIETMEAMVEAISSGQLKLKESPPQLNGEDACAIIDLLDEVGACC